MPPLTLEQVLARSMRLPRQRTQRYVSKLYHGDPASATAGHAHAPHASRAGAWTSETTTPVVAHPSRSSAVVPGGGSGAAALPATSTRAEKLHFFALMEQEDTTRRAGRLAIHRSGHLVRNSTDLTTFLNAALRTGDWADGLRAFAEATALPAFERLVHADAPASRAPASPPSPPTSSVSLTGVNPNLGHVLTLLDMCAAAQQYTLVERIGAFFAPAFPEALAHAVELLVAAPTGAAPPSPAPSSSSSAASNAHAVPTGWRAGFAYLTTRCPLPAAELPVEAFNVCLRGCEAVRDWRGALEIVRAMGPNPLQGWRAADEGPAAATSVAASTTAAAAAAVPLTKDGCAPPWDGAAQGCGAELEEGSPTKAVRTPGESFSSTPPPPNVVSYATLIATLEQSGKDHLASEVLNRLPVVEKEEITASYAALIVVWSNQVSNKHRRRF